MLAVSLRKNKQHTHLLGELMERTWLLLEPWARLRQWKVPHSLPRPGVWVWPTVHITRAIPRMCLRKRKLLLRSPGLNTWLNQLMPPYKCLRLASLCGALLILQPPKTSLIFTFSCLLYLPPTHLEWTTSFFHFPLLYKQDNFKLYSGHPRRGWEPTIVREPGD